jgi:hypothetical protein
MVDYVQMAPSAMRRRATASVDGISQRCRLRDETLSLDNLVDIKTDVFVRGQFVKSQVAGRDLGYAKGGAEEDAWDRSKSGEYLAFRRCVPLC